MGQTATNPQTGEKVELVDGAWVPVTQTATNPATGEKVQLVDGNWTPVPTQEKPGLRSRVVEGMRDFADENLFPDGLGEMVTDGITRGAARLIEDPNTGLAEGVQNFVVDPVINMAAAPGRMMMGAGYNLQANLAEDPRVAQRLRQEANKLNIDASIGLVEGGTLLAGGAPTKALRQAERTAPASGIIGDFERSGVSPSIATAAKGEVPAATAQQVSENLIAGGPVRKNVGAQINQASQRVENIADSLDAGANTYVSGEAIINGVLAHRSLAGRGYKRADELIDYKRPVPTALSTLEKIDGELRRFDSDTLQKVFEPGILKRVRGALEEGGSFTVNDIRELRTKVREAKGKPSIIRDKDDVALIRLEKSLTEDLHNAVELTSGKEAVAALKTADRLYAETLKRVDDALKPFSKDGQTPEGAFVALRQAMQGQTTSRGRGNLKQITELKKALSPAELDTVKAGMFRGMGRTSEGSDFSVSHFATEWRKMGNTQKDVLFGKGELRKDMDAVANVVERLNRMPRAANNSRSGVNVQNMASAVGLANPSTLKLTALALGSANVTGRLLTNPKYVKMVRALTDAEYRASRAATRATQLKILANAKKEALTTIAVIEVSDETYRGELASLREALNDNEPLSSAKSRTGPL